MDKLNTSMLAALHAVFDREPQAEPVFRVHWPDGLRMRVADGTLTLTRPDGADTYALDALSLAELIDRIEADGYTVPWQSDRETSRGAHTLIAVDQDQYDRDTLDAYINPVWAHMDALAAGIVPARDQIAPMLRQIVLPQSEAAWADLFGRIFGIPRRGAETDAVYTRRIIVEVGRARSSPIAILENIRRLTGESLALREPWMEIFELSRSALSGPDHLQGAPIWQYHTMQLVARVAPDWPAVLREANADRPAGTLMLDPATHPWPMTTPAAFDGLSILLARTIATASVVAWFEQGRLSMDLALSAGPRPSRNEAAARIHVRALSTVGLRGPYSSLGDAARGWYGPWDGRQWAPEPPAAEIYPPKTEEP